MPIDVNNFIVPEQSMGGLYKVGDTLAKENYRKRQAADDAQKEQLSSTKYLANYFDPKDHLTGSQFDPTTNQLLGKAYNQALDLVKQNVPLSQILMATSPLVNKVNDYMVKGKAYNEQKKAAIAAYGNIEGIDKDRLGKEMDRLAFPIDPKTGEVDINKFDPNADYTDLALRTGEVYNSEGFGQSVKEAQPLTTKARFKDVNSKGGYESGDYEVTAKNLFVPNVDIKTGNIDQAEKFVPKHEIITDDNAELLHTFRGDKGDVKAPVRVVTDEMFYKQISPSARAFALQEAKKHLVGQIDPVTGKPIKVDDPKVELFAKSVAYDELKARQTGSLKRAEISRENPATVVKNYINSGDKQKVDINDVYAGIASKAQDPTAAITVKGDRVGTRFNALDADAQEIISTFVNKNRSVKLDPEELFVNEENGKIKVYSTGSNNEIKSELRGGKYYPSEKQLIYTLPERTTNLAAKQTGKEAKSAIIGKESSGGKKVYNPKTGKFE